MPFEKWGEGFKEHKDNEPIPSSADDGAPIQTRFGSGRALNGVVYMEVSYRGSLLESPIFLFAVECGTIRFIRSCKCKAFDFDFPSP
jgi:hypothetical protein